LIKRDGVMWLITEVDYVLERETSHNK